MAKVVAFNGSPRKDGNTSILIGHMFETLFCNETLQFKDFDKVVYSYADPKERQKRHKEIFPQDCKRAYDLGARLVQAAKRA